MLFYYHSETTDGIELTIMNASSQRTSITPPVQCSSCTSMVDGNSNTCGRASTTPTNYQASTGLAHRITPADSMEYINNMIKNKEEFRRVKGNNILLSIEIDIN